MASSSNTQTNMNQVYINPNDEMDKLKIKIKTHLKILNNKTQAPIPETSATHLHVSVYH